MDVLANEIIKSALAASGHVSVLASEEDDGPVEVGDGNLVVVFDPLDGSRNIEVSIPTGSIFGIYAREGRSALESTLQPGRNQLIAGYALYSSATLLVLTMGRGTHGFTLDRDLGAFVLSHPDITIPPRGQIYSVNDARYFDWPLGLQKYIDTVRQGKGETQKQYSAQKQYVCSLVADLHRTLIYGGVAMNPRSHLRLLYEGNPLGFVTEQAGGLATDGDRRILDISPTEVHQRLPLFLGSPEDIREMQSYGSIQQKENPGYTV